MDNQLIIFENEQFGTVRTITINGEPWFVAIDVCKCLDINDTGRATGRLDDDELTRIKIESGGQTREVIAVNEPGLYALVLGSRKPEAKAFKRWITHEVLPSIRKTGQYVASSNRYSLEDETKSLEVAARMLDANDASKIIMLSKFYDERGIAHGFLPKYESNGSRQLIAATHLLKQNGIKTSPAAFNSKMIDAGFMEIRTRLSSKGGEKSFKALTKKGLKYGENQIPPQNPREVQPMYYENTFADLCKELGLVL